MEIIKKELIGVVKYWNDHKPGEIELVVHFSNFKNNISSFAGHFIKSDIENVEQIIIGSLVKFYFIENKHPRVIKIVSNELELFDIIQETNNSFFKIAVEKILKSRILNLGHCGLRDWPIEIFEMTWIEVLIMGDITTWDDERKKLIEKRENISYENQNNLDHIPDHIKTLKNLKVFSIGGDYAKYYPIKSIGGLRELKSLEVLDLSFCRLESMKEISGFQNLQYLDLSDNLISTTEVYGIFRNLKTLKLSNNKISEIKYCNGYSSLLEIDLSKNSINKIENIELLKEVKSFKLSHNQITEIEGFNNKIQPESIEFLDLSWNKIEKIEGLEKLINLKILWLRNNNITEIKGLEQNKLLEILDISDNQILVIPKLRYLSYLKKLALYQNQILKFADLNDFKSLILKLEHLAIHDNPFTEVPWISQEWLIEFGDNKNKILDRLDEYIKSSDSFNSDYEPPTKIILLGNTGAGKSTLALSLILDRIPTEKEREETTHGLKIRKWEKANAIIYDFGGQDYYHALYNVFFTNQTQYVVIWNDRTNYNDFHNSDGKDSFFHFDHCYWLGNIDYFLNDKDKTNTIALFNSFNKSHFYIGNDDISTYKVNHFYPVAFPYPKDIEDNIEDLQRQIVAMAINKSLASLKNIKGYHKLEAELMNRVAKKIDDYKTQTTPLNRIDFFETFEIDKKDLKESSIDEDSLLSLLHHRGLIYRLKGKSFHDDKIWVNPESLNFAIHEKLSIVELVKTEGIIKQAEVTTYFNEDILAIMMETQMIFKHEYGPSETEKVVEYILPQYLPLSDGSALYHLATSDMKQSFTLKFRDFLPQGMMSRLICRFGLEPDKKYFYRYEMIFTIISIDAKIKIKLDMITMTIVVHVVLSKAQERLRSQVYQYLFASILGAYQRENIEHLNFEAFMAALKATNQNEQVKIDTIAKEIIKYVPSGMMLSIDGQQFVDYKDLQSGTPNFIPGIKYVNEDLISFEKTTIQRHLFNAFVNEKSKSPKRLFISYSSQNTAFMKALMTHLKPLERDGLITVWVDRMIETGTEWNDEIQKQLEDADMIVYLISPHFIATPYIMDIEVANGIEFYHRSKGQENAVKLYFIHLMDCNWSRSFGAYQQKLDADFLTKRIQIIKTPDNHESWMTVINDLESTL